MFKFQKCAARGEIIKSFLRRSKKVIHRVLLKLVDSEAFHEPC